MAVGMLSLISPLWGAESGSPAQELPERVIVVTGRDRSVPVFPIPSYVPKVLLPAPDARRIRMEPWEPVPAPRGEFRGIPREEEFPLPAEL